MTLHRGADRLRDNEADLGSVVTTVSKSVVQRMHDEIGLNRPRSVANRDTEISRPCHPVPGRKHCPLPCVESRSQGTAALAATARHDGAACARTHTQPEAVHTGPAAVVRLESPLALGHGCFSSFGLVSTTSVTMTLMAAEDAATVGKLIHLAGAAPLRFEKNHRVAAVSPRAGDCSRVLTRFAWVKPGQTRSPTARAQPHPVTKTTSVTIFAVPVRNLSAMLPNGWPLREKTVSFSQCRFEVRRRRNQSEDDTGREPADHNRYVQSSDTGSTPTDSATITTDYCPQSVDNYVDSLLSSPPGTSRGSR